MKVDVKCTYVVTIDVPDEWDDDTIHFYVEENGCPGTGTIGLALDRRMEEAKAGSFCWACGDLQGENEVVNIHRSVS